MTGNPNPEIIQLTWGGHYEPETDVLFCGHNAGFFSNCCVTLWNIADLHSATGRFPARINFSHAFSAYRNSGQLLGQTDLYPLFFQPGRQEDPQGIFPYSPKHRYPPNHGLYRFLDYDRLRPVIERYFQPSSRAQEVRAELIRHYEIDPATTLAVVYRGTDKSTEVKVASPEAYLGLTRTLLLRYPHYRVWIQTDESEVRDMFCRAFGDRCFFLHEMPVSTNGLAVHDLQDHALNMDRSEFGVLLVAVNSLLAQADIVINHTGNMALWLCLFRGHADGVWQFDDEGQLLNPGYPTCYWAAFRRLMLKTTRKIQRMRNLALRGTS
jgi:hypothetical protein